MNTQTPAMIMICIFGVGGHPQNSCLDWFSVVFSSLKDRSLSLFRRARTIANQPDLNYTARLGAISPIL
jgi:hypothetical protein